MGNRISVSKISCHGVTLLPTFCGLLLIRIAGRLRPSGAGIWAMGLIPFFTSTSRRLGRFVAWCGRNRTVVEVSPAEVAEYAHQIGRGGAESALRLSPIKSFLAFWKTEGWIETSLAAHLRIARSRRNSSS